MEPLVLRRATGEMSREFVYQDLVPSIVLRRLRVYAHLIVRIGERNVDPV